jgi:hypothetical protein
MMDCKSMEKSHDDRSEEVERHRYSRHVLVSTIKWLVNVFGEYSTGYFLCCENSSKWSLAMRIE